MNDKRTTILVVEDDPDALETIAWLLESAGYEVLAAREGGEALDLLERAGADVVLLDMRMPGMDGWQFRERQRRDPKLAEIPVVLLTGDRGATRDAEALRANDCLRKPVELGQLLPAIERLTHRA